MFIERLKGVFLLKSMTFEEIEHDENATRQAAIVVIVVALVTGVGTALFSSLTDSSAFWGAVSAIAWAIIGWLVWSAVSFFVGTSLFDGVATFQEMLRVIGFAYAPQVLAIVPCIGPLVGMIWSLAAGFVAIRQGLDLDDFKAFLTAAVGLAVYGLGYLLLNVVLSLLGALF